MLAHAADDRLHELAMWRVDLAPEVANVTNRSCNLRLGDNPIRSTNKPVILSRAQRSRKIRGCFSKLLPVAVYHSVLGPRKSHSQFREIVWHKANERSDLQSGQTPTRQG